MRLLLHWVLSALAVWIVAHVVPGIQRKRSGGGVDRGRWSSA